MKKPSNIIPRIASTIISRIISILGGREARVTEDDVHKVLLKGEESGALLSGERNMVEGVFYLGERPVAAFMTHRSEVECLSLDADARTVLDVLDAARGGDGNAPGRQTFFPVVKETLDDLAGIVSAEDILFTLLDLSESKSGSPKTKQTGWSLKHIVQKACCIPETMTALKAFEAFKRENTDYLCVMDEYGGFAGTLTLRDLIEAIVGELSVSNEDEAVVKLEDGSYLVDGNISIDTLAEELSLALEKNDHKDYHTLAGYVLSMAEEIPRTGAVFAGNGFSYKIVDMDGNRIDKVLICKGGIT